MRGFAPDLLNRIELLLMREAFTECEGNVAAAAELLGVSKAKMNARMEADNQALLRRAKEFDAQSAEGEGTLQENIDRVALTRIKAALATTNGNRVAAAAALGIERTTLYRLMKRFDLMGFQ